MSDKKKQQLGMNPSTASHRLVKDLLWNFIQTTGQSLCCKCGKPMSRETFSIEHVRPWLDSDDPVGLYFDVGNISYSHMSCNREAVRRCGPQSRAMCGQVAKYQQGCRCADCVEAIALYRKAKYSPESRHQKYLRTGN